MKLFDFDAVAPRPLVPGYVGRYIHSDQVTQGRVDIDAGALLQVHSHPHEQWTMLVKGSFELTVNGTPHLMTPGQIIYIAPHEPHSARAITACQVQDVFHPPRDDYR
jgi:unsaturated pyranuronate lyase